MEYQQEDALPGYAGRVGRVGVAVDQPVCSHQGEIVEIDLAIIVQVTGEDVSADALQGKTMAGSRCYRYKVISRRGRRLAPPIIAPYGNRAVRAQAKTMVFSRCYCGKGIRGIGQVQGTVDALLTPAEDGVRTGGGGEHRPKAEEQGTEAERPAPAASAILRVHFSTLLQAPTILLILKTKAAGRRQYECSTLHGQYARKIRRAYRAITWLAGVPQAFFRRMHVASFVVSACCRCNRAVAMETSRRSAALILRRILLS